MIFVQRLSVRVLISSSNFYKTFNTDQNWNHMITYKYTIDFQWDNVIMTEHI